MSFVSSAAFGLAGLTRSPTALMSGTSWRNKPSHFAASTLLIKATLVTLPSGRLRVATRPNLTGSVPIAKTTGMTVVYLVLGYGLSLKQHSVLYWGLTFASLVARRQRKQSSGNWFIYRSDRLL